MIAIRPPDLDPVIRHLGTVLARERRKAVEYAIATALLTPALVVRARRPGRKECAMRGTRVRGILCVLLALSQVGCRSEYRFRCTSKPSEAGVVIGERMMGETPCTVKIPRKSGLIQDGKIEFTFCLPDGQERKRVVDLHDLKPTNPVAMAVASPFLLAGVGMLWLAGIDKNDENSYAQDSEQSKDLGGRACSALLGLGTIGVGAGVYSLLGGHADSLSDYPVRVDFSESKSGPGR
jgi:hypothetical protein